MRITTATARGERRYQEDTFINVQMSQGTLLGVFDGHGGDEASKWMARNFEAQFQDQRDVRLGLRSAISKSAAMLRGCISGTTASVAFLPTDSSTVYTAVIGDSPIICHKQTEGSIDTPQKYWYGPDHNVRTNRAERDAAIKRGGYYNNGYICKGLYGPGLQMGRALGDAELSPILSHEPEISHVFPVGEWMLIGSDGIFDPAHYDFKEAAEEIILAIELGDDAPRLVERAVAKPTGDNATAILVRF